MTPRPQPCMVSPRPPANDVFFHRSSTTATDQLSVMRRMECSGYQTTNYPKDRHDVSSYRQRRLTVDYLYQVVDYGGFQREVVCYAMTHLMDRYLHVSQTRLALESRNHYQLVALTCLYMAVKILEPQNIGVDSLIPLANCVYSRHDFLAMEGSILNALDWRVTQGPTPLAFVQLLLTLLPQSVPESTASELYHHAQYQLELAVSDHPLCCRKPSELAVAALWNALEGMDVNLFSLKQQALYQDKVLQVLYWQGSQLKDSEVAHEALEGRISGVQDRLRQLLLAALSLTTASNTSDQVQSSTSSSPSSTMECVGSDSPVSTLRKDPAMEDSIKDVSQTGLLLCAQ